MTLDDIRRVDSAGMYDAVRTFPDQWREGRQIALQAVKRHVFRKDYRQVVVVGMGGSAIGGEFLRTLALDEAKVPVLVSRSYAFCVKLPPAFIEWNPSNNARVVVVTVDQGLEFSAIVISGLG